MLHAARIFQQILSMERRSSVFTFHGQKQLASLGVIAFSLRPTIHSAQSGLLKTILQLTSLPNQTLHYLLIDQKIVGMLLQKTNFFVLPLVRFLYVILHLSLILLLVYRYLQKI